MEVTEAGSEMLFSFPQPEKAFSPMVVTESAIDTLVFFAGHIISVVLSLLYRTPS